MRVMGIDCQVTYDCDPSKDEPTIVMPSHTSMIDVFATYAHSIKPVNYVFKISLLYIPFFGMFGYKAGNIPIKRTKLQSAIDSLKVAAEQVKRENRMIAISPEGTRRRKNSTGDVEQLLPFKKGPFHLAKDSNASIIPVVWIGCRRLSNGGIFRQGNNF